VTLTLISVYPSYRDIFVREPGDRPNMAP
jgi:hypothetical protein